MVREPEEVKQPLEEIETKTSPPSEKDARWMVEYNLLYWTLKANLYGGWPKQNQKGEFTIVRPKKAQQFMNDKGIENTMAFFNAFINKIDALSIYGDDERILDKCKELHKGLASHYYNHMEEYELPRDKASIVISMIVGSFESNLRKSLGGGMLRALGETETVHTVLTDSKKGGIMSRLGF